MSVETVVLASSNLASATYDDEEQTLEIDFLSGDSWTYRGVPPEVWAGLKSAASKGGYFYRQIRDQYLGEPS